MISNTNGYLLEYFWHEVVHSFCSLNPVIKNVYCSYVHKFHS